MWRSIAVGVAALLVLGRPRVAAADIVVETFTSRSAFEARLGPLTVVGFDDVPTTGDAAVPIASDRYAAQGLLINGQSGQYVSRTFSDPTNYPPFSSPNMYAPGPIEDVVGGNETDVRFRAGDVGGAVAGFGAVFIDVDSQDELNFFPSSLDAFDADSRPRGSVEVVGGNAEAVFRGIVTVDSVSGEPVPVISRVRLTNGGGWPGGAQNQGVPLDEFVFAAPATTTTTTTNAPTTTTSTTVIACPSAPVSGCREAPTAGGSRLVIVDHASGPRDAFIWRWTRPAVGKDEFREAFREVFLCLYDEQGLQFDVGLPTDARCGERSCWRDRGTRLLYRDPTQSRRGIVRVILDAGNPGGSPTQVLWLGQGGKLAPAAPPLALPVRVQMFSGSVCWEGEFSSARKNENGRFRALSD